MSGKKVREKWSWEVFVACMFIGLGVGMILGESGAGIIMGMGVGFILGAFLKVRRKFEIRVPRGVGGAALILVGMGFILFGLNMLEIIPLKFLRHLGGLIVVGIGVLILAAGAKILRE